MEIEKKDTASAQATAQNEEKKKKRPGRPRKNPIREPKPRNGISLRPFDETNFMEFIYDKPIIFKKLWQYFKLMAVDKIQMIFRKKEIIIWGEDHHKKSIMRVKINANKINHYYCQDELDIGIDCRKLELIMIKIDKTYGSMLFLSKIGYTQENLNITLKNDIEIDENHAVGLIGEYNKLEDENAFLDSKYTISFGFPGRYFKKKITDINSFSDQITILQDSNTDPLMFEYITPDKKIVSHNVVRNDKNIKFNSNLGEDESFRVSFKTDYVKPVSSALLSEYINIYAHESKPLLFVIKMDEGAVELRILTKIIDERDVVDAQPSRGK